MHRSLRRSKSAEPNELFKKTLKNSVTNNRLRMTHLEAYIPVAVVEYLKLQCQNKQFVQGKELTSDDFPLTEHEEETAVMFADVSSFTTISEKMTAFGPGGLEKLVENLNDLFDVILAKIRKAGGDVLKFAGDAIEIYWPRQNDQNLSHVVKIAVKVALEIQKVVKARFTPTDFRPYPLHISSTGSKDPMTSPEASDDSLADKMLNLPQELQVKLGVGVGKLSVVHLGGSPDPLNRSCVEFIPVGKGIVDSHSCERKAKAGQVIISEGVYHVISSMGFETELLKDTTAEDPLFLVTKYNPAKRSGGKKSTSASRQSLGPPLNVAPGSVHGDDEDISDGEDRSEERVASKSCSAFAEVGASPLNPGAVVFNRDLLEDILKGYLPTTVMPYVMKQHEFWLPEFRRVTTLFIKIFLESEKIEAITIGREEETNLVQDCFRIIQETVFRYEGTINKMFFDKGSWNVLIVFGLSPFAHDDDSLRGLLCSLAVVGLLDKRLGSVQKDDKTLSRCSAGVTTGLAFCGVLGTTQTFLSSRKRTLRLANSNGRGKRGEARVVSKASRYSEMSYDHLHSVKREQKEYTVIGDCINLASRFMDLAYKENASLLLDRETKRANEETINCVEYSRSPVSVKGKEQKVIVFQVASESREQSQEHAAYQEVKVDQLRRMSVLRTRPSSKSSRKQLRKSKSGKSVFHRLSMFGTRGKGQDLSTEIKAANLGYVDEEETPKKAAVKVRKPKRVSILRRQPAKKDEGQVVSITAASSKTDRRKAKPRRGSNKSAKGGVHVKNMHITESKLVSSLAKKSPERRSTLVLHGGAGTKMVQMIPGASPDEGLDFVHKRLIAVQSAFLSSCQTIRTQKIYPMNLSPQPAPRRRSIMKNISRMSSTTNNVVKVQDFSRVRLVCVEGSIGAGKTHAIAQVFLSNRFKKNAMVMVAANSPFAKRDTRNGFAVWYTLFDYWKKTYMRQNGKTSINDLVLMLLENSAEAFELSPIAKSCKPSDKKTHKVDHRYLYLLNDILGTEFVKQSDAFTEAFPAVDFEFDQLEIDESLLKRIVKPESAHRAVPKGAEETSEKALRLTVYLLAAVFTGMGKTTWDWSERELVAVIEDSHVMTSFSWLLCVELVEWWSASNLLLVMGLRNVLFVDPNEGKKQLYRASQAYSLRFNPSDIEALALDGDKDLSNQQSSFKLAGKKSFSAREDLMANKQGYTPFFRNYMKTASCAELVPLKNLASFIWPIIKHAFDLDDSDLPPSALIGFLSAKTSGNPLYIIDALKQYEAEGLLKFKNSSSNEDSKGRKLVLYPSFQNKLDANSLSMPISVESLCGMFLDSLSVVQQIALKVAAMFEDKFNRKMVREGFPIEDLRRNLDEEWDALVAADVIELVESRANGAVLPFNGTIRSRRATPSAGAVNQMSQMSAHDDFDDDTVFYKFQAEWVKESLVNRMLFKQRDFLSKKVNR